MLSPLASAQDYPTRTIKIIVPAPPGGAIDLIARVVGEKLATSLGQPVIVDNKPGASNNLGTDALAHSTPDGYTIGIVGGSHNTNKFLFKNLRWDPEKSFEPIVYTHEVPLVFAIYPQIPAKTLPEFIAWMKANPEQAKAGNARAVAVSTKKRTASLPDVPTADAQGLKGYNANANGGFLAPAGTPKAIIAKRNGAINAALKLPDVRSKLEAVGIEVQGGTPQDYAALIHADLAKWGKVVKDAGIPAE